MRTQRRKIREEQEKEKKRQERKAFLQAQKEELREHKSSFLVFSILRLLVIVSLLRELMRGSYESAFFCLLTLLLLYAPSWVQVRFQIELPPPLEITVLLFIYAAEILGEVDAFYVIIPGWDTMLHTLNGFLAAAVGFSMVILLNDNDKLTFDLSPFFLAMMAFCFSMTIGVLWEFFEFAMDIFLHTDMQKDTIVHAIYSVALNPDPVNAVVAIPDIRTVAVNGAELGLSGYLDIGLIDTMKDLLVNFLGALVFSSACFVYARNRGRRRSAALDVALDFVPGRKAAKTDGQDRVNAQTPSPYTGDSGQE